MDFFAKSFGVEQNRIIVQSIRSNDTFKSRKAEILDL